MSGLPDRPYDAVIAAPFGALGARLEGERLTGLDFLPPGTPLKDSPSPLLRRVRAELDAYYADPAHVFDLPLAYPGTPFRQRVWAAIGAIPAGRTETYGEIARRLGSAPRAIGQATGDNPLPIIVPCHRVLAAKGLGGFMHSGDDFPLSVKRWLLRHEGAL